MVVDFSPYVAVSDCFNSRSIFKVKFLLDYVGVDSLLGKCIRFGIIWAKSVTNCGHCFPFLQVQNGSNGAIFRNAKFLFRSFNVAI